MVWAREPLEGAGAAAEERLGFRGPARSKDSPLCPGLPLPGASPTVGTLLLGIRSLDFM